MSRQSERVVVAHVVLPLTEPFDVLPLYVDSPATDALRLVGRRSVAALPGRRISLGSYFNAFPASYWSAYSSVRTARLTFRAHGAGRVILRASGADDRIRTLAEISVDGDVEEEHALDLADFREGGACWLDMVAADEELVLVSAEWSVELPAGRRRTASVGMATFNRPDDCVRQLRALASDESLDAVIDRVVVVDQGTDAVADAPAFAEAQRGLADRLVLVRQRNLGGSGGFSRAMAEILERGESDDVLLLDDDAITEPESVFRAVRFADAASAPLIIGGGMLHLDARTTLYAQSEQWDERIGWVRLNRPGAYDHDFGRIPFRDATHLHRVQRSDFNGWWMCLIPVSLIREAGLSLPLFLKGDDVEFGRRARAHGVPTVSIPGIALWHLGWGGKAPTRTWEAYFLHRNRLIGELLHSPRRRPSGVVLHSFLGDMKPLLTLQYSAVRLRAQAIVDVLRGPEPLAGWLETRAAEVRALRSRFPDATPVTAAPAPASARVPRAPGSRAAGALLLAATVARQLFVGASEASRRRPDVSVPAEELGWWTFAACDSALVRSPDGQASTWYRRSRGATVRAAWTSVRLHARLWWEWPRLARAYRAASSRLAAPASWRALFSA